MVPDLALSVLLHTCWDASIIDFVTRAPFFFWGGVFLRASYDVTDPCSGESLVRPGHGSMQAVVVLLSHRTCTNWLRVTWYFDLHDILGMNNLFERFTENIMLADIPRALSFVRRPLERKLQNYNESMKVEANSELTRSSEEKLVSVRAACIAAQGSVGIALVWFCSCVVQCVVALHSITSFFLGGRGHARDHHRTGSDRAG